MGGFDGWRRFLYRVKAGKLRARNPNETPLVINLRQAYHRTAIGAFSKVVSDWSHHAWLKFFGHLVHTWRLYWFRRTCVVAGTFLLSVWWGYIFSGFAKNLVTLGYFQGFYQPFDISLNMMNAYGADDKVKYTMQLITLFDEGIDSRGESYDILDWLVFG